MIHYEIKKGRLEGKYFLVFICDNKDLVDRASWGIGYLAEEFSDKLNKLRQSKF